MYTYEISIALNGHHLFTVKTDKDYSKLLNLFIIKFPKSEGYSIIGSRMIAVNTIIDYII